MKRTQQGFTLIELIVVIVILGVLAVTASPKFGDLTGDAKDGVLGGLETAMVGAINIEYSRSLIGGGDGSYPGTDNTTSGIVDKLDLDDSWVVIYTGGTDATDATEVRIYPSGHVTDSSGDHVASVTAAPYNTCYVGYTGNGKSNVSNVTGC